MSDVRIVVYESKIAAMALPGGQIFRWTKRRRDAVEALAVATCPMRTGSLKASINGVYRPFARNHIRMEVHAGNELADYALWVHEGTRAEITPLGPNPMRLRPWPPHGWKSKWVVSGQRAQPFLRNALERVMRREI